MKISTLDKTVQKTHIWLADVLAELKWKNPEHAFLAIKAVLHAVRDRLPSAEAVQFGAQLPTFLRGVYYEGWKMGRAPLSHPKAGAFLAQITREFRPRISTTKESIARAVLNVLARHVSNGEMQQIRNLVPKDVRALWPRSTIRLRMAA